MLSQNTPYSKFFYYAFSAICLAYIFMKIPFYEKFKALEPIAFLAVIYFFIAAKDERLSLPVSFFFMALFYSIVSWAIGHYWLFPEYFYYNPEAHQLTRLFIFLPLAYFLNGDDRKIFISLIAAIAGILITPWTLGDGFNEILEGLQGRRIDFGIQNAQHTGMFFGVILICCLCFFYRALMNKKYLLFSAMILTSLFSLFSIYATQNRATLLGLFVVLILFVFFSIHKFNIKEKPFFTILIIALACGLYLAGAETLEKSGKEHQRLETLWSGEIKSIESTSIGARLVSWKAASEWIKESPLIGFGSRGSSVVLQNTDWLKGTYPSTFGHMHSSYIEMLVRYGIIGFFIFFSLFSWITIKLFHAYRAGFLQKDMYYFLMLSLVFMLIVNLTESYFFYSTGSYLISFLTAISVSYIWKYQKAEFKS